MAAFSRTSGRCHAGLLWCLLWTSLDKLPGVNAVAASPHSSLMRKNKLEVQSTSTVAPVAHQESLSRASSEPKSQIQLSDLKDERLTLTEFTRKGCEGDPQNEYTFYPRGDNAADFVDQDCVTVRSQGVDAGHFGISCHPDTGEALINKYVRSGMHDVTCHETEPILLKIIHADARNLFSGDCVQAEMPDAEGFSKPIYIRFGHIDDRVTWPRCSSFSERSKHNVLVLLLAAIVPLVCCCCVGGGILAYFSWSTLELYAGKLGYPLRRKIDSRNIYGYGENGGEARSYGDNGEGAGNGAAGKMEEPSGEAVSQEGSAVEVEGNNQSC